MGCDIHTHVEFRRGRYGTGEKWQCGDYFATLNPLDPDAEYVLQEFHDDRNYSLFAVLADVRNYDCVDYIDDPRGLPDDVTDYVKEDYESWGYDAHSCSYVTLRELIEYHNEHKPKDVFGHYILVPLINDLKRRAEVFNLIYDFEWTGSKCRETLEKAEGVRLVFWFDN